MSIQKGTDPITNLDEWGQRSGVKEGHWRDGRSAKELARAWLASLPAMPPEVGPLFGSVTRWSAEPESRIRFDDFGGPANIDLFVKAEDDQGPFSIVVEAKADEPFGCHLSVALAKALEAKLKSSDSKALTRIEQLAKALFGPHRRGEPPLGILRYQLLTASAAALAAGNADGGSRVVLLIHEFITTRTKFRNHDTNARDLDNFVARLSPGVEKRIEIGRLHGPYSVPGDPLFGPGSKFYIKKVSRDLRCP